MNSKLGIGNYEDYLFVCIGLKISSSITSSILFLGYTNTTALSHYQLPTN